MRIVCCAQWLLRLFRPRLNSTRMSTFYVFFYFRSAVNFALQYSHLFSKKFRHHRPCGSIITNSTDCKRSVVSVVTSVIPHFDMTAGDYRKYRSLGEHDLLHVSTLLLPCGLCLIIRHKCTLNLRSSQLSLLHGLVTGNSFALQRLPPRLKCLTWTVGSSELVPTSECQNSNRWLFVTHMPSPQVIGAAHLSENITPPFKISGTQCSWIGVGVVMCNALHWTTSHSFNPKSVTFLLQDSLSTTTPEVAIFIWQ